LSHFACRSCSSSFRTVIAKKIFNHDAKY
jgi:hypothetical protein